MELYAADQLADSPTIVCKVRPYQCRNMQQHVALRHCQDVTDNSLNDVIARQVIENIAVVRDAGNTSRIEQGVAADLISDHYAVASRSAAVCV